MKSNRKKRILAAILCMVMVLTSNISALAEGESLLMAGQEQTASEVQTPVPEGTTGDAAAQPTQEPVPEPVTPEPTPELTPAPTEVPPTPEVTPETTPEATPEPTKEPETPQTPEPTLEPTVTPEPTGTPGGDGTEQDQEETITPEPTPEVTPEPEEVLSEATELTQELKDASGQLVQKVTAKLPAGAFQAETSQITMEVTMLDTASENHIKNLMEKRLPQGDLLGDYILYDIKFKVNGEIADALQPITITFEKSDLEIKDVKKANVFYYDPADPAVAGDQDELVEIIQRSEMIENLQNSGQGTEQLEEYDLSSITVGEDKRSGQIELEGRKSTIYGCYVEYTPVLTMNFENEEVAVSVSADETGIIPEDVTLQVLPITEDDKATKVQYEEVAKQIQEKIAEEEKELAGFLAYDISFVDAAGNEVEPKGKVKVSMKYKKAALPEEVKENGGEDAEVSVLHLEEDAEGNVKDVVNMSEKETTKVDTLITTNGPMIKEMNTETESFSVFAITWIAAGEKITVHYVNDKYQEITGDSVQKEEISGTNDEVIDIFTYALEIPGYTFDRVVTIGKGETAPELRYVKYDSKKEVLRYSEYEDYGWEDWNASKGYHVYLRYHETKNASGATIETVDNNAENIKINLFDYSLYNTENKETEESAYDQNKKKYTNITGINAKGEGLWGSGFMFMSDAGGNGAYVPELNMWTGSDTPKQDIVKEALINGFPQLKNRKSLKYLFDGETFKGKKVYSNVTGLLTKDQDGYYSYDSDLNYAEFDADANQFKVYNSGLKMFYPFDSYQEVVNKGEPTSFHGGSVGFGANRGINHYFGLTMEAKFYQPKGGKINGKDMVFEFSGDDDVWVFVDDKLVLDLGGIHDKASGSINFSTGQVFVNGTSRKNMFEILSKDSFDAYSTHTIKFFYLERGNNASNCKLKFNLPTIPDNSVMVSKEVQGKDGVSVDYSDIDFKFHIEKVNSSEDEFTYDLYENNKVIEQNRKTKDHGHFTLRHNQSAVFSDFKDTDQYIVKEIGASLGDGYEIDINKDTNVTIKNEEGQEVGNIQSATTGKLTVHETPSVLFKNRVKSVGKLIIEKKLEKDEPNGREETFVIQLKVNGKLYDGQYTVDDEVKYAKAGKILLKADQKAEISGFPYGTRFEIEELLDGSYRPTYAVSGAIYDVQIDTSVKGEISGEGTVTVTNRKIEITSGKTDVTVHKTWKDEEKYQNHIPKSVKVTLYEDVNGNNKWDEEDTKVTTNAAGDPLNPEGELKAPDWSYTWFNLSEEKNYIVKEECPDGFLWNIYSSNNHLTNLKYIDRVEHCSKLQFPLGRNNMLLVKKGSDYFIWTANNLELQSDELQDIQRAIETMGLSGLGKIHSLSYMWGDRPNEGMYLTPTSQGWKLEFDAKSTWSEFWQLQYDRVENVELVNTINEEYTIDLTVRKEWVGCNPDAIPENITVQLYRDGELYPEEPYATPVKIEASQDWEYVFKNLDYYDKTDYHVYEYTVKETHIGESPVEETDYQVSVSPIEDGVITITNAKPWRIMKISTSSTEDRKVYLKDAVFKLESKIGKEVFYGKTDDTGLLKWYTDSECEKIYKGVLPDDTYTLREIKAPSGYMLSKEEWTISIENGYPKSIISNTQEEIKPDSNENQVTYYFKNAPVYDLPSTGGPGIFVYTIGGTLLLMAAALFLYKMKREEVLKR